MKANALAVTGVVVHLGKIGDAHRLVEVLTVDYGRMTLLARGARASKRRFAGILDLFSTLHLQVQPGRGMATLEAADPANLRLGIRTDLDRIARASTLCRCVRALVAPTEAASEMLTALEHGLDFLHAGALPQAAAVYPQMLAAAGILPEAHQVAASGVRAVLQGAPVESERLARELEGWACAWVARHTGAPVAVVSALL